uniref:Trigger factor n=1 Tax=candidate division WWE3 bacterium TaxID=2053526 RepID=A0A831Z2J3_UNCKA
MTDTQISLKDSEITLTIRIPADQVEKAFARVKQNALKEVRIPGFRPGKAPSKLAESQLDEDRLAQALFQEVVPLAYAQAVSQHKLRPIVPPQVTVKSFQKGEDLVFEARTAEAPPVSLGNYQKALRSIKGKVIYGPDGKPLGKGEKITASQVLEKLRESVPVDVPHILVDYEVQRMLSSLVDQVNSLGLTVEQYLSSQGKRAEELQKEYHEIAERNLKDEFILSQAAREIQVEVSEKEIEEAIEAAPDEKTKAGLQEPRGKAYLEDVLRKRKTIEHLIRLAEGTENSKS